MIIHFNLAITINYFTKKIIEIAKKTIIQGWTKVGTIFQGPQLDSQQGYRVAARLIV